MTDGTQREAAGEEGAGVLDGRMGLKAPGADVVQGLVTACDDLGREVDAVGRAASANSRIGNGHQETAEHLRVAIGHLERAKRALIHARAAAHWAGRGGDREPGGDT